MRIELDVREFEHPEPLQKALEAFGALGEGDILHMIHRKNPLPLFELVCGRGGFYHSFEDDGGVWHILITKDPSIALDAIHV